MLRSKHRIFLKDSAFLFGVIDECGVLNENQVSGWVARAEHARLQSTFRLLLNLVICP
jgi:hypothetical protein